MHLVSMIPRELLRTASDHPYATVDKFVVEKALSIHDHLVKNWASFEGIQFGCLETLGAPTEGFPDTPRRLGLKGASGCAHQVHIQVPPCDHVSRKMWQARSRTRGGHVAYSPQ